MYLPEPIYNAKPVVIFTAAAFVSVEPGILFNLSAACLVCAGLLIIRARGII